MPVCSMISRPTVVFGSWNAGRQCMNFTFGFSVWSSNGFWVYWAPFYMSAIAMLLGIPVYKAMKGKMTTPEAVPEYR